eukprot:s1812_g5.t1
MSAAFTKLVNALIAEERYEVALQACDEYLPVDSDLTDQSAVHRELLDHECMYRVKGHTLAAQLTLDRYKRWDVDTAVQTLSMPSQVVGQVGEAVEHLLSLQQHDMARTLAQMYGMTDPLHSLELSRLHYLFTTKHDKTNAVNRHGVREVTLATLCECLSLIQRTAGLKDRLGIRTAPSAQEAHPDGALFQKALVDMGVPAEMVRGYDGRMPSEVIEALQLLKEYGNAASLHSTVSNWMVCMHTSPGKPPNLGAAMSELWSNLFRMSPRNVDELLQHDHHGCVPKVIAIAAAHVRLWRDLASGKLPTQGASSEGEPDPWYLVMEDDVVIKLFFFGHWRAEDQVGNSSLPGPFLEAKDPLRGWDLVTSALYELLHGAGWSKVPAAGFYAGTQAYLIRPSGARKLLEFRTTQQLEAPASPGHRAHQAEDEGLGGPWCLTGSPRKDLEIRSRHHFEEAPNSGLTERILELCSDSPDNAAACFHICDELSLRLYDLTPKSGPGKTLATSAPWQPGMPLTSVRLLTFLIRRLLSYLQGKPSAKSHIMARPSDLPTYDYSVLLFAKLLVWQHLAEAFGCRQGPLSGMPFPNNWMYRLSKGTLKYSCLPQLGGNKRNVVDNMVHWLFFITGWGFLL